MIFLLIEFFLVAIYFIGVGFFLLASFCGGGEGIEWHRILLWPFYVGRSE
jgi:hypothetical protein